MIPKKRKYISNQAAENLKLPVELVDDVVLEFYRYVKTQMSSVKHRRINCTGLGTFVMIEDRVDRKIKHLEKLSSEFDMDNCSYNQYAVHLKRRDLLLDLYKIKEKFKSEKERKQKLTKIRRNAFNRNLEKQG